MFRCWLQIKRFDALQHFANLGTGMYDAVFYATAQKIDANRRFKLTLGKIDPEAEGVEAFHDRRDIRLAFFHRISYDDKLVEVNLGDDADDGRAQELHH